MSNQYSKITTNLRIDLSEHGLNSKIVRYKELGNNITVKTLDERNARFAPSLHRFNNLMYMLNHPVKFEAYLK